jgi:hypothetical protein
VCALLHVLNKTKQTGFTKANAEIEQPQAFQGAVGISLDIAERLADRM